MGFFERNRASLAERGIEPARLPPQGVRVRDLLAECGGAAPGATHILETAEHGYTTNLPLADVLGDQAHG